MKPFSDEALQLLQSDLEAHDAGDKGASECLRDLGPDLARRLLEAEDELKLVNAAIRSAKAANGALETALAAERAEVQRLQSQSILDSDTINKLQERLDTQLAETERAHLLAIDRASENQRLTLQLQAIELAKPKKKPAAERIEDKLKEMGA